ncbi:phosphoribosyl-aminoimidazole-succinocarboxamide synthase [Grosmannia clavigera kw1407]|uniref:Phosphoribosylaminoimidazole-succinocarboxamide synthase n=1 Tax=Grosmannia clavigera (strain kw1407 / UAMH 11150) TaxID=655863 RepID=F0XK21_GROCL|nr:phosphoribosyl-aminoimidazole-succinocarboxamide synthase [Grosmannia clavigera kw1407]EFX02007.1 phosphoribosyl-aminoimidazole-succinocarboxamide synthase [Grosmannia clavigera kw1407]
MATAVTTLDLPGLHKIATGKVREVFETEGDDQTLLFVATDRISAYDVVLQNGIPGKGTVLTQLSAYWFHLLAEAAIPGKPLRTHLVSLSPSSSSSSSSSSSLAPTELALLRGRCMRVRRLRMFPVEAIVRGYLAGSAYAEYVQHGTVHGESDPVRFPPGMARCQRLPAPVYTPSTKAELGQHDENISRERAAQLIGNPVHAARIEELALAVYTAAAAHARDRGVIIADTKFEFGLDEATGEVVLADEVLTPDSSRFWLADNYQPGREQDSLDKQFLRDWLVQHGLKGKDGVAMPPDIAQATADRYAEVFRLLTGNTVEAALEKLDKQ